jgi:ABC-2 type transport system ATP-binding protein
VAIIDNGRILADGSPSELKSSLGTETVLTLTLAEGDRESVRAHAAAAPGVVRTELEGAVLRVHTERSGGLLSDLVVAASASGVPVVEASSQPPTLESVFLSLTGRDLRE